jgi:hypothetical protein
MTSLHHAFLQLDSIEGPETEASRYLCFIAS